jgi:hypothetical protein
MPVMKNLALALTLVFSGSVFADSFSCTSTIGLEDKAKKIVTVTETAIEIEGQESKPIIETVKAAIDGKSLKKCAGKSPAAQYKCLNKIVPKAKEGDSTVSLHTALLQIADIEPDNKEAVGTVSTFDVANKSDINTSAVASGIVYVFKIGSYFSNSGVYEYFNAAGDSLGKFYIDAIPKNCR